MFIHAEVFEKWSADKVYTSTWPNGQASVKTSRCLHRGTECLKCDPCEYHVANFDK